MAKQVKIDRIKLTLAFRRRGLTYAQASRECGYSSNYFSEAAYRGKMPAPAAMLLKARYHMEREEYEAEPEQIEAREHIPEPAVAAASGVRLEKADLDRLYEVIYTAVHDAVQMAMTE